jgi:hypothetical protein
MTDWWKRAAPALLFDPAVDLGNESQPEYQFELVEVECAFGYLRAAGASRIRLDSYILRRVSFMWVYVKKPSPLAPANA